MRKCIFATIVGENEVLVAEINAPSNDVAWGRLIIDDSCWKRIFVMSSDVTSEPETKPGHLKDCIKQMSGEEFQKIYPQWVHNLKLEKMK